MRIAVTALLLLLLAPRALPQQNTPAPPFLFVAVGITNQVEERVTDTYGPNPWFSVSGGFGASLSRHAYLLGRISYTFSTKDVNSSFGSTNVNQTNSWYQLQGDAGPLFVFDLAEEFRFGISGGLSVMWRQTETPGGNANLSSSHILGGGFLGLSLERALGDSKWSLLAEGQYCAFIKDNSTVNSNAASLMIGTRYFPRSDK